MALKDYAAFLGIAAASLVFGIAAQGITRSWQDGRQERLVAANEEQIFHSPASFVAGNPEGNVSVVAFFDHNCPYCRGDAPALAKLVAEDGQVRLVLKELPVLGPDSEDVAKVALAAMRQGKYFELYQRLFAEPGRATKAKALRLAGELGLDAARLERDMQDPAIVAALAENKRLAHSLKARGVPFYLVGDRILGESAPNLYDVLTQKVADIRAAQSRSAAGP